MARRGPTGAGLVWRASVPVHLLCFDAAMAQRDSSGAGWPVGWRWGRWPGRGSGSGPGCSRCGSPTAGSVRLQLLVLKLRGGVADAGWRSALRAGG